MAPTASDWQSFFEDAIQGYNSGIKLPSLNPLTNVFRGNMGLRPADSLQGAVNQPLGYNESLLNPGAARGLNFSTDTAFQGSFAESDPLQGYQQGGVVPGQGEGDKIPIMAEPGEIVIPNEVVNVFGPDYFLGLIDAGKAVARRQAGGLSDVPSTPPPPASRMEEEDDPSESGYQQGGTVQPPYGEYDYDGYQQQTGLRTPLSGGHWPDTFKRQSHMTFSDESKYSSPDQQGGRWASLPTAIRGVRADHFYASPYNLTQHSPEEMREYFQNHPEEGTLHLPEGYADGGLVMDPDWKQKMQNASLGLGSPLVVERPTPPAPQPAPGRGALEYNPNWAKEMPQTVHRMGEDLYPYRKAIYDFVAQGTPNAQSFEQATGRAPVAPSAASAKAATPQTRAATASSSPKVSAPASSQRQVSTGSKQRPTRRSGTGRGVNSGAQGSQQTVRSSDPYLVNTGGPLPSNNLDFMNQQNVANKPYITADDLLAAMAGNKGGGVKPPQGVEIGEVGSTPGWGEKFVPVTTLSPGGGKTIEVVYPGAGGKMPAYHEIPAGLTFDEFYKQAKGLGLSQKDQLALKEMMAKIEREQAATKKENAQIGYITGPQTAAEWARASNESAGAGERSAGANLKRGQLRELQSFPGGRAKTKMQVDAIDKDITEVSKNIRLSKAERAQQLKVLRNRRNALIGLESEPTIRRVVGTGTDKKTGKRVIRYDNGDLEYAK